MHLIAMERRLKELILATAQLLGAAFWPHSPCCGLAIVSSTTQSEILQAQLQKEARLSSGFCGFHAEFGRFGNLNTVSNSYL